MPTLIPAGITLETVTYSGLSRDKKNLLFLGDGFAAIDRALFDTTITEIVARFFRRAPFNLRGFRNEFNIFKAFTPSPSSGISSLLDIDANGLTNDSDNTAIIGPIVGKLQDKLSALGLTYGLQARTIIPKVGDENLVRDFLATLSHPTEALADTAIPHCWAKSTNLVDFITGKDFTLVIVLVNDDKRAGSYTFGNPYTALSLGLENHFSLGATISPGIYAHTPSSPRNNYNVITARMHHELCHAHFNLNDEYCYNHDPAAATTVGYFNTEQNANAITRADVLSGAGQFDPSKIKWYKEAYPGSSDKIISTDAFDYMNTNHKPLWERLAGTNCATIGYDANVKYPPISVRGTIRYPQRIIGAYEGGGAEVCGTYKPAGSCRMLSTEIDSDFCYVCKHAIVEKVNSSYLQALFTHFYPR